MDHKAVHFVSFSLGHSDLNSHFKLAHKGVTRKVSGSTTEITLKLQSVYEMKMFIFFYENTRKTCTRTLLPFLDMFFSSRYISI